MIYADLQIVKEKWEIQFIPESIIYKRYLNETFDVLWLTVSFPEVCNEQCTIPRRFYKKNHWKFRYINK